MLSSACASALALVGVLAAPLPSGSPSERAPAPVANPPAAPSQTTIIVQAPRQELPQVESSGLGLLIAGPITTALGAPLSLLGNEAWRKGCGPTTPTRECARGTSLTILSHSLAGVAFATGISLTAAGGHQRGLFDASRFARRGVIGQRSVFVAAGAVLLPVSLIGLGMARLFFWLPTPDCADEACVRFYQRASTASVGGLALLASAGAGMLLYGTSFQRSTRLLSRLTFAPQIGRKRAGFGLTGRF